MNRSIGFACRCVSNLVKRKMCESEAVRESQQLTGMHGFVIKYIYEHQGEDVYQRDLEKRFEIRRSTATQMLSLMEKNGLILRQPVSHDARLKRLVLTPKAVALHKNVEKEIKGIEESLMQGVSVEEMEIFFAVIDKVKANLTAKE